jgi:hypothetical protein
MIMIRKNKRSNKMDVVQRRLEGLLLLLIGYSGEKGVTINHPKCYNYSDDINPLYWSTYSEPKDMLYQVLLQSNIRKASFQTNLSGKGGRGNLLSKGR